MIFYRNWIHSRSRSLCKRIHNAFEFRFDRFLCFNWTFVRGKKFTFFGFQNKSKPMELKFLHQPMAKTTFPPQWLFFFSLFIVIYSDISFTFIFIIIIFSKETPKKVSFYFSILWLSESAYRASVPLSRIFLPWILNCELFSYIC